MQCTAFEGSLRGARWLDGCHGAELSGRILALMYCRPVRAPTDQAGALKPPGGSRDTLQAGPPPTISLSSRT